MESLPFDRGAMRECFRLKKLSQKLSEAGDWQRTSNYVAKRYIAPVNKQVYFDDVRLQMEAKLWGEAFNRYNPPKKVDIFQLSVLELHSDGSRPSEHTGISSPEFYHIERYMEGEYRKYNSNSGFVDECLRNTPQL
uniref:Putative Elongation factor 2 kinase (EEF-2 kinase) (EEF-2K) (Calcium/calmodulin-dependent eukaryotic elongation factor-2 kinase) n=1 Tax=Schistosoma japonicum TaxID=6182 RepID=C1LJ28_SCHJA|nr:putative Elongation factor 2 kinase (eEF-2 kinase) (eEF-2K) (Calcium/calmodulin-dependent eukaryotic elongation factor-2 kinase) [Schistosoma japonicum]